MDERRSALAVLLCILVVMVYSEVVISPLTRQAALNQPQPTAEPCEPVTNATNGGATNNQQITLPPTNGKAPTITKTASSFPTPAQYEEAGEVQIESALTSTTITLLGGRLTSLKLKDYAVELHGEERLDLIETIEGGGYPLGISSGGNTDTFVQYAIQSVSGAGQDNLYTVPSNGELSVALIGTLPDGRTIKKILTFNDKSYMVNLRVELSAAPPDATNMWLEWRKYDALGSEQQRINPLRFATLSAEDTLETTLLTDVDPGLSNPINGRWISLAGKYFMASLVSPEGYTPIRIQRTEENLFVSQIAGQQQAGVFEVYVGPKVYADLRKIGYELHRNVDFGIFSFLAHPFLSVIRFFYFVFGNWGLAIILFTLLIKTILLPLTKVSFSSMQKMQDLQPEIKKLRERYDDPSELNRQMMALYKKHDVNPMGGCLPMLLQLPVFLGLYNALLNAIELRHSSFALWITDLSSPERLELFGIGIPVMIIIMGISMLVQQWVTPSSGDPAQKKAMMIVPVVFTVMFIIFPFPSGLVLYWLTNNLISIIQSMHLRSDKKASPLQATGVASVIIFAFGYVLTLF